jgi:hypothetical protein
MITSPLPIEGPPVNCVELIIYDDDGPEGYFNRLRFTRSWEAIEAIIENFPTRKERSCYNFELTNHWHKSA